MKTKTITMTYKGRAYTLRATLGALRELDERVGDPLARMISVSQGKEAAPLSLAGAIDTLAIALRAAGCTESHDDIATALFENPIDDYYLAANTYTGMFFRARPSQHVTEEEASPKAAADVSPQP